MKLVLLAAVVLLFALLTADYRWRPLALGGAFLVRIGIPSAVSSATVLGGLHLSTFLIIAYAIVWPLVTPKVASNAEKRLPQIPFLCHVTLVTVAAGSVMMSQSSSAALYIATLTMNQLVAPYIFCMLIYAVSQRNAEFYESAGKFYVLVCVAESIIAMAVRYHFIPQPFQASFAANSWWFAIDATRQLGTLDHSLCLGLLLAAGLPMVAYFDSPWIAMFSGGIIVLGLALTESRLAAAAAGIGFAYLVAFGTRTNARRLGVIGGGVIAFLFALQFGVFSLLIDRFVDDRGSSLARTRSWTCFSDTWTDYFVQQGFQASGESAAVAYAVGIGIPLTLIYFSLIVWLIGYGVRKSSRLAPASMAAIGIFIFIQLFSSISNESAVGMILWATIGIALAYPRTVPSSSVQTSRSDQIRGTRELQTNTPTAVRSPAV